MRNKADILAVARELFSRQGYRGTGMRSLAKSLNIREATLYAHIGTKEQLLWEIVHQAAQAFLVQAESVPVDLPVEEQMKRLVYGHLTIIAYEKHAATVFFNEWRFLSADRQAQIKQMRDMYEASFQRVIEEGATQGLFQVVDTRLATLFVLSALNWTYQWMKPADRLLIRQLADVYLLFIMRLLKADVCKYCGKL